MSTLGLDTPRDIRIEIEHKEPTFREDWHFPIPTGTVDFNTVYNTDNTQTDQTVPGGLSTTRARWEGNLLIVEWNTSGFVTKRAISLSANGKTMTFYIDQCCLEINGMSTSEKMVFEKQ
jgi:hypothetical protein